MPGRSLPPPVGTGDARRRVLDAIPAALVALGVTAVHVALADPAPGPRIVADEVGYLANAVQLGTGAVVNMRETAFYSGGWSLVMAPLARAFGDDRLGFYRSVVVVQVGLALVTTLLLIHLTRSVGRTGRATALAAGAAGGLFPAYVMDTGLAWSEAALTFAVVLAVAAIWHLLRSPPDDATSWRSAAWTGVACGAALGFAAIVHRRLLGPAALAMAVLVVWALVERRRRAVSFGVPALAIVVLFGHFVDDHLLATVWSGDTADLHLGSKVGLFTSVHGWGELMSSVAGQVWYLLVASGGLVGVAVVGALLTVWRQRHGTVDERARCWLSAVVLVLFAGLLAVSAAFVSGATERADYLVYGRYPEVMAPLLIAGGLAWLLTADRRDAVVAVASTVGVTAVCWFVVDVLNRSDLDRPMNPLNLAGAVGWLDLTSARPLLRGTIWSMAALVAMGFISVSRGRLHPAVRTCGVTAVVLALFGWQIAQIRTDIVDSLRRGAEPYPSIVAAVRRAGATAVAVDPQLGRGPVVNLSFRMPGVTVDLDDDLDHGQACLLVTGAPAPGDVVVAGNGPLRMVRRPEPCAL
jgi:hypothetical protein